MKVATPYRTHPNVLIFQVIQNAAYLKNGKRDLKKIAFILYPFYDHIKNIKEQILILRQYSQSSNEIRRFARENKGVHDKTLQLAELIEKLREKE